METINSVELRDETIYPDIEVLSSVLGEAFESYLSLIDLYKKNDLVNEWRYYKDGKAWLGKVQKKKKTIVWMSVWKGYTQAAIYFPVRLLDEILALDISEVQKEKIMQTKSVGKSKPCIFEIRNQDDLIDLEKVIQFKISIK